MDVSDLAAALPVDDLFVKLDDDTTLLLCAALGGRGCAALQQACKRLDALLGAHDALWDRLARAELGNALPSSGKRTPHAEFKHQCSLRAHILSLMTVGRGDISAPPVSEQLDAIAFPTNPGLLNPGVPGALRMVHMRAGPSLEEHLLRRPDVMAALKSDFGGIMPGNVIVTPAFNLQLARNIVHAVGPVPGFHGPPGGAAQLAVTIATYRAIFAALHENNLSKVAVSAIGTGLASVPAEGSAATAVQACIEWATARAAAEGLGWFAGRSVFFCCYEPHVKDCFDAAVRRYAAQSLQPVISA